MHIPESNNNAEEQYCLIRWSDEKCFDIVPQQQFRVPPESITVYNTYAIDVNGKEREGTVILKGIHILR